MPCNRSEEQNKKIKQKLFNLFFASVVNSPKKTVLSYLKTGNIVLKT